MFSANQAGKIIGALLLTQFAIGIFLNFAALPPLFGGQGYLVTGADNIAKFGIATFVAIFMSGIGLLIACFIYPIFREKCPTLSLMTVAIPCVNLVLTVIEFAHVMEMASYSKMYVAAASDDVKAMLETLKPMVSDGRNWAHYLAITFSGFNFVLLYLLMFRASSVPRLLSGFGVLAAILQLVAVVQPFFGGAVLFDLMIPIALAQLILPIYFIIKGLGVKEAHLA